jgi:RNA polymerase sigma-70 factor (ECF subfamily)
MASLRDREAAESLTQDCFINAYRARYQFRGAASIGTWLMQIAANLLRDYHASCRMKFWRRAICSGVDPADLGDWIPDQHGSPEAMALAKEQVNAIWKAVARLSVRQRTVFLLRFIEDMDLLEIARITGMKEGTVKTHLFRALQSVRARLVPCPPEKVLDDTMEPGIRRGSGDLKKESSRAVTGLEAKK